MNDEKILEIIIPHFSIEISRSLAGLMPKTAEHIHKYLESLDQLENKNRRKIYGIEKVEDARFYSNDTNRGFGGYNYRDQTYQNRYRKESFNKENLSSVDDIQENMTIISMEKMTGKELLRSTDSKDQKRRLIKREISIQIQNSIQDRIMNNFIEKRRKKETIM
ncbi:hypothetical protein HHI36_023901 [Cryptolaemus montrouzieri]|uniref:Uncharacterized protein n=1 Tax=Cryptolaemus montrouzieri TaxID=559131 RepID=A0ABD2NP78_9CUCU